MKRTLLATGLVLALAAPALAQDDGGAANWQKVVACAQENSEKRRHECIDRLLAETGVLSDPRRVEAIAVDERTTFGLTQAQQEEAQRKAGDTAAVAAPAPVPPAPAPQAAAPAPAPVPRPAPSVAAAPPAPVQPERLDSIVTTIAKSFDPGNRMLVFVTAEGQIWQQNESKDIGLPPRAGTAFTVEKGALGAFICRVGGSRSFRCRRQG